MALTISALGALNRHTGVRTLNLDLDGKPVALAIIEDATFAGLLDSLGGAGDFLSELVGAYVASSPELFASMRQAIATGDAPALQRAAHSLKTGSASNLNQVSTN